MVAEKIIFFKCIAQFCKGVKHNFAKGKVISEGKNDKS